MPKIQITQADFLEDHQGRTFADVVNDPAQPLNAALRFFDDLKEGMPFRSVRERCRQHESAAAKKTNENNDSSLASQLTNALDHEGGANAL